MSGIFVGLFKRCQEVKLRLMIQRLRYQGQRKPSGFLFSVSRETD